MAKPGEPDVDGITPMFNDHTPVDGVIHRYPPGTGVRGGMHGSGRHKSRPFDLDSVRAAITKGVDRGEPVGSTTPWLTGEIRGLRNVELTPEEAQAMLAKVIPLRQAERSGRVFSFPDENGKVAVRLTLGDPPDVWVDETLAWDQAAKQFWNAVYRLIGKPAPFVPG
jgi:hypothetical protein